MATNTLEILLKVSGAGKASAEIKKLDGTLDKVGGTAGTTGGKFNKLKESLTTSYASILKVAGVATTVIAGLTAIGVAAKRLGDDFMNYAFQVEDFARIIGATPEEASKFIQVADDVRVSVQSLTTAMRAAIQRGYAPTIENLGKLSDQYRSIQDPIQRSKFLLDTFGRSGLEIAKIMELGSEKIKEMGDSVEGTARLMTEEGIKAAKDYYDAMDALGDATEDLKLALGKALLPAIKAVAAAMTGWANLIIKDIALFEALSAALKDGSVSAGEWRDILIKATSAQAAYFDISKLVEDALKEQTDTTDETARATNLLGNELDDAGDSAGEAVVDLKKYNEELRKAARQKEIALKFSFAFPDITDQIGNYFDEKKWSEAGGKAVEAAFDAIKKKMEEGLAPADLAEAEKQLQQLAAAAEAIKVALGEQTRWDAIQNLRDSLGLTYQEAKDLYEAVKLLMKGGTGNPWKVLLTLSQQWQKAPKPGAPSNPPGTITPPYVPPTPPYQLGGSVFPYKSYLVGERGPEMFIPNSAGRIINNQTTNQLIGGAKTTIENEFNIYPPQIIDVRQLARLVTREQNRTAAR